MKYEWKKHEKALYLPKAVPAPVTVPEHAFFMIRGEGNPNGEAFLEAIGVLYALSYAVKMLPKKGDAPEGYYEYAVFPLEGVWDTAEPMLPGEALNKDALRYTLMIRQPDFVTDELAERILAATSRKKPHPLYASASFGHWNDGLCVQMLHVGPYDDEPVSFNMMQAYCAEHGLRRASDSHREIYLGTSENGTAVWRGALCLRTHPSTTKAASLQKTRRKRLFYMERVSRDSIGPKAFAGKRGAQAVPAGLGKGKGKHGGAPPFSRKFAPPRFFIPQSSPSKHPSPRQCPPGSCRRPEPDRGVRRRNRRWARQLP